MAKLKKPTEKRRTEVIMTRVSKAELAQLEEICQLEKTTRAVLLRDALKFFTNAYDAHNANSRETLLDKRMQQLDKHLSSLLVKAIKISAQGLYWSRLHWQGGPPKSRINEQGLEMLDKQSTIYALGRLSRKQKTIDET